MQKNQLNKLAKIAVASLASLAVIMGAAYYVVIEGKTALGAKVQDWIWEDQINQMTNYKADFAAKVTYTDKGTFTFTPSKLGKKFELSTDKAELEQWDREYGFTLKNLSANMGLTGFFNFENFQNAKGFAWITTQVKNNDKSYDAKLDTKLVNHMLFTRYDYNENIQALIRKYESNYQDPYKNVWVKESDQQSVQQFLDDMKQILTDAEQGNNGLTYEQQQALKNYRLLKIKKFVGMETINNQSTLHYRLDLNRTRMKAFIEEQLLTDIPDMTDSQRKKLADAIAKKMNIQKYDIWIGANDRKIYKYDLSVDMLSITKMLSKLQKDLLAGKYDELSGVGEPAVTETTRDAMRASHFRQIETALMLYHDEHGSYPVSKKGVPQDFDDYFYEYPVAPTPPDGGCTKSSNTYYYTQTRSGQGFTLTACLGADTSGYRKGKIVATENGVDGKYLTEDDNEGYNPYEDYPSYQMTDEEFDMLYKFIKGLPFDATLQLSYDVFDYNADKPVWPANPYAERQRYNYYGEVENYLMKSWGKAEEMLK